MCDFNLNNTDGIYSMNQSRIFHGVRVMALKFNILLIYLFVVSVGGRASTEVSGTYALPKSAK